MYARGIGIFFLPFNTASLSHKYGRKTHFCKKVSKIGNKKLSIFKKLYYLCIVNNEIKRINILLTN